MTVRLNCISIHRAQEARGLLRVRRIATAWTPLLAVLTVLGLVTSEGEPVCEGPFVFRVDDSLPPQCPSPAEFLPMVAIAWLVGLSVMLLVQGPVRAGSRRTSSDP